MSKPSQCEAICGHGARCQNRHCGLDRIGRRLCGIHHKHGTSGDATAPEVPGVTMSTDMAELVLRAASMLELTVRSKSWLRGPGRCWADRVKQRENP